MAKKKARNAGASTSAEQKKALFVEAYITNGGNATEAAKTAGYSAKTAYSSGGRLLKNVEISTEIARRRAQELESARKITGLTIERTLREVARIAYSDGRQFFRPDGSLIPVHELDEDTAATIASIEVDEIKSGDAVIGVTRKIKVWDKNSALEKAMKHLGQYERDNAQGAEALAKAFVYVPEKNGRRAASA